MGTLEEDLGKALGSALPHRAVQGSESVVCFLVFYALAYPFLL